MNEYERIEKELVQMFGAGKFANNKKFITAIIELVTENEGDKLALQLIEKKEEKVRELNNQAKKTMREAEKSQKEASELWEKIKDAKAALDACETAEARDKIRLLNLYKNDETIKYANRETVARGISNILGNGRSSNGPTKED